MGRSAGEARKLPPGLQNVSTGSQSVLDRTVCAYMRACVRMRAQSAAEEWTFCPGMIMGQDAGSLGRVAPVLSFLLFGSVTSPPEGQGQ